MNPSYQFNMIILWTFYGLTVLRCKEVLKTCDNPILHKPCPLTCIFDIEDVAYELQLLKDGEVIKTFLFTGDRNSLAMKVVTLVPSEHTFREHEPLMKYDEGYYECTVDNITRTRAMLLKPYSFERGEISTAKLTKQTIAISVKAHCVYPKPKIIVRFCSKVVCQTRYPRITQDADGRVLCNDKSYMNYDYTCYLNLYTACESRDGLPIQVLIYANDHLVFNEYTKATYTAIGNSDMIYIHQPAFMTAVVGFGSVILITIACMILMKKGICHTNGNQCENSSMTVKNFYHIADTHNYLVKDI